VIVIRISDFNDILYRISENEENSFILNMTSGLKSILNKDSVVLAPAKNLFLIKSPVFDDGNDARKLMEAIDNIFTEIQFSNYPTFNIDYLSGVAISDSSSNDSIELLKNAFIALEAIIKIKKTKYLVYNENIYDIVRKDKTIRNELKYAFEKNEFSVLYQVQKNTENKNIGVEALVRWKNEKLGNVPPDLFVPIMEESEYIKKLGLHVLKTVIKDFETIKDIIPEGFKISINLSSNEFTDKAVVESLLNIISLSKLNLENFCFEITETTLVDNLEHTNKIIKYLHEKNILVSIDDFGTGFSSLGYLKTLYADKLKVDRTFIKDYPEKDDGTMIKAIVSLATQLKIGVIVEGIENEAQLNLIKSLNCKEYQGYYGSKPIGFKKFTSLFILPNKKS
jgi:EAL domain-containing protein (putative c-di-GMP-specific phosphodiesterase class I)